MGCGIEFLKWLGESRTLPRQGRLLDIGESCLLAATPEDIDEVLQRHACPLDPDHRRGIAVELAYRSTQFGNPYIPTLFLGDVLRLTAVEYVAFDVVSAYYADRFDLNVHSLARECHNTFDVVVNFGTTEHLMNQFNAFKVIHEACKPGGYMFHQLPATGYLTHGYFCYNALMFQELAEANGYEVADLWFYGPQGSPDTVLVNGGRFPGVLDPTKLRNDVGQFRGAGVPNSLINVLFRKRHEGVYRVGLEVKTAAGSLDGSGYTSRYIQKPGAAALRPAA
ncbi:MAG TPA: methyltransferase domain-containing protein [Urbifossiella sp.]|jgi:hypothetical protein|nr:methyltransferase domain-containing protein [Urbifossiella sp.]